MCFLTYICDNIFLFHTLFYYKNGDGVFHLMEVLLYQACENGLTLGQALQVYCSIVQSFLSNCCQNCATNTWSLYIVMWIICFPMLLLAKQYHRMKIVWVILCQYYQGNTHIHYFSTHLSKTNFAIASSLPWTGFIPIAWLSALNSCTRFSNLFAWCKAWPKATKVSEYVQEKPQSHTACQTKAPRGRQR